MQLLPGMNFHQQVIQQVQAQQVQQQQLHHFLYQQQQQQQLQQQQQQQQQNMLLSQQQMFPALPFTQYQYNAVGGGPSMNVLSPELMAAVLMKQNQQSGGL